MAKSKAKPSYYIWKPLQLTDAKISQKIVRATLGDINDYTSFDQLCLAALEQSHQTKIDPDNLAALIYLEERIFDTTNPEKNPEPEIIDLSLVYPLTKQDWGLVKNLSSICAKPADIYLLNNEYFTIRGFDIRAKRIVDRMHESMNSPNNQMLRTSA